MSKLYTKSQIDHLRTAFGSINKVDPYSPTMAALSKVLTEKSDELLAQTVLADIKWMSHMARMEVCRRANVSYSQADAWAKNKI